MKSGLQGIVKSLRKSVCGPELASLYRKARARHAVLEPYSTLANLVDAVASASGNDYAEREAITQAFLSEHALGCKPQWSSVLMVLYYPMLMRLRCRVVSSEVCGEDMDQLVLESFLSVVASYRPDTWTSHAPLRLAQLTRRNVFHTLRREYVERMRREREYELQELAPHVPLGAACDPPMTFRVDRLIELIEDELPGEGAVLLLQTELASASLASVVSRIAGSSASSRERTYARLKRSRSRAKKKIIDMVNLSPLGGRKPLPAGETAEC